jgi:hypothetical protein
VVTFVNWKLLVRTGTGQRGDLSKNIGPLPNLKGMSAYLNLKDCTNSRMQCQTGGKPGSWMRSRGPSGTSTCSSKCILKINNGIYNQYLSWWTCGKC